MLAKNSNSYYCKHMTKASRCLSVLFAAGSSLFFAFPAKLKAEAGESTPPVPDLAEINREAAPIPSFEVPPTQAAIEGESRPELGASLADSLAAGLLREGKSRVVESEGADFRLVSRFIEESETYRLTVRKIRLEDGELVAVYSSTAEADESTPFVLVDDVLAQMHPKPVKKQLPRLDEPSFRPKITLPKIQPKPAPKPAYTRDDFTFEELHPRYERERVGLVKEINEDWQFVIIKPEAGSNIKKLEILEILYDGPNGEVPYAKLSIDRMEDGTIIASYGGENQLKRTLFPGEFVYAVRKQ